MILGAEWTYNDGDLSTNGIVSGKSVKDCKDEVELMLSRLYDNKNVEKDKIKIKEDTSSNPDWL